MRSEEIARLTRSATNLALASSGMMDLARSALASPGVMDLARSGTNLALASSGMMDLARSALASPGVMDWARSAVNLGDIAVEIASRYETRTVGFEPEPVSLADDDEALDPMELTGADALLVLYVSAVSMLLLLWSSPPGRSWLQENAVLFSTLLAVTGIYLVLSDRFE